MTTLPFAQRVEREASKVDLARIALWIITMPFLVLGWTASKVVIMGAFVLRFIVAGLKVGYEEGMKSARGR